MGRIGPIVVAVCAFAAACGGRQDPGTARLEARVADLEAQVARLQADAERRDRDLGRRVDEALRQLQDGARALQATLDRLAAAPAAPAAPPAPRPHQPDPALTYAVPLDDSPSEGPRHAKVTIVMGMEFACPFCRRSWDTVAALRTKYGRDLRVVYKTFIVHQPQATLAAKAACAAHHQRRWKRMAQGLWDKAFTSHDFSEGNLVTIGRDAGLDVAGLVADMHGPACVAEIQRDHDELARLGQTGTPTFWINGRVLVGAQPIDRFEALIDEEMIKAERAIRGGTRLADYYDELVRTGVPEVK